MIKFDQVTKRYPGSLEAIKHVSFSIQEGELVFVTGHSGAGKSTLLKLISALEYPSHGTVLVANQNISQLKANAIPFMRRRFGVVFQDHKLLYDRTVFDNVILALHIKGIFGQDADPLVRAALNKVGLLHKAKMMPISLSGGEQQRLAIARAVVSRPTILIADEPTGNLDADYAAEIMRIFSDFHQIGVTVVIATHDAQNLIRPEHRVLRLHQGHLQD